MAGRNSRHRIGGLSPEEEGIEWRHGRESGSHSNRAQRPTRMEGEGEAGELYDLGKRQPAQISLGLSDNQL